MTTVIQQLSTKTLAGKPTSQVNPKFVDNVENTDNVSTYECVIFTFHVEGL